MDDTTTPTIDEALSRRNLLLGLGAVAGAGVALGAVSGTALAGSLPTLGGATPEALGATVPGLTYIGFDAQAFLPSSPQQRVYQDITGTQGGANDRIWANLPIPSGSVITQISVGYQQQPIVEISKRPINQPNPANAPVQVFQLSLPISPGGPFSSTVNLATPVTLEQTSTYTLSFFLTAGSSVFGASVGYLPPAQAFVPFTGTTPRVLDTRNGSTKLGINEERVVSMGFVGARSAVFNLTVVETEGGAGGLPGGFVAAFPANVGWPGNSSANWDHAGQISANLVVSGLDANGALKLRGGVNRTDVVIDRVGFLI